MVMTESALRSAGTLVDTSRLGEAQQRVVAGLDMIGCVHHGCSADAHCEDCSRCNVHCRCGPAAKHVGVADAIQVGLLEFWLEELAARQRFRQRVQSMRRG